MVCMCGYLLHCLALDCCYRCCLLSKREREKIFMFSFLLLLRPPSPSPHRLHVVIEKHRNTSTNYRRKKSASNDNKTKSATAPNRGHTKVEERWNDRAKQVSIPIATCCSIYRNNDEKKKCEIFISDRKDWITALVSKFLFNTTQNRRKVKIITIIPYSVDCCACFSMRYDGF